MLSLLSPVLLLDWIAVFMLEVPWSVSFFTFMLNCHWRLLTSLYFLRSNLADFLFLIMLFLYFAGENLFISSRGIDLLLFLGTSAALVVYSASAIWIFSMKYFLIGSLFPS